MIRGPRGRVTVVITAKHAGQSRDISNEKDEKRYISQELEGDGVNQESLSPNRRRQVRESKWWKRDHSKKYVVC